MYLCVLFLACIIIYGNITIINEMREGNKILKEMLLAYANGILLCKSCYSYPCTDSCERNIIFKESKINDKSN